MESQEPVISKREALLRQFADRTSSVASLYPGFESWSDTLQIWKTRSVWLGAGEPWAPHKVRADTAERFFADVRSQGHKAGLLPVSDRLARELSARGFGTIAIGCEAVFSLRDYFEGKEPVFGIASARPLWRKGAKMSEVRFESLDEATRSRWVSWADARRDARGRKPLAFLNQIRPWEFSEWKRYFVLRHQDKDLAWVSAAQIPAKNAYFLMDYFKSPEAPGNGSLELAIIETMRTLYREGAAEVRWGLVPYFWPEEQLRESKVSLQTRLLSRFGRIQGPFSFAGLARFKCKFKPTRWEEQFAVSSESRIGPGLLLGIVRAHYPDLDRPLGDLAVGALRRVSGTLCLVLGMAALFASGLQSSGYQVSPWTGSGWLLGPFFHRHSWHLFGDLLSITLIGGGIEAVLGKRLWLSALLLGFWATNPLTHALLATLLPLFRPEALGAFLAETDIGSSNAAYAFAGLWAARSKRPAWILVPFLLNALVVNLSRESWLALHHFTGLGLGYLLGAKKEAMARAISRGSSK